MSPHEVINLGDVAEAGIGTDLPSQSTQKKHAPGEESNFADGSGSLFNMYLGMADEEDNKMTESWKADADGILVFTGLFSAAVAALVAVSVQDLQPSSQDTSAFYLQNIYQLLSDPDRSNPTIPFTPAILPAFSPPKHAVWVNSLWFLSLAISLTCGLQATLLQQWARRYIKITQSRKSPYKRARIRAFFFEGVQKLHLPWAVETLPTLLHLSLFLFFAGLLIFLFNINHTVFTVVAWWIGLCVATYLSVTLMPLFRRDSPYYAPLSFSAWFLVIGTICIIFKLLDFLVAKCFDTACDWPPYRARLVDLQIQFERWFRRGIRETAEDAALEQSPEIGRLFRWMVSSLDEDHELEQFFAGIPDFFKSTVVEDPNNTFKEGWTPSVDLLQLMHRTLSSHTLSDLAKQRRIAICRKAMDAASFPVYSYPLNIAINDWDEFSRSIDSGLILKAAAHGDSGGLNHVQCMISIVLARVQKHDDRWCELATGHLGVSESVLKNYLAHGDSALLANLNCVIRRAFDYFLDSPWDTRHTTKTLKSVSDFDVQTTLPELQHDFCTLWNELVLKSQDTSYFDRQFASAILTGIGHIYITLHPGTTSALPTPTLMEIVRGESSPYPLCTIAGHHPDSASHIHKDAVGTTELPAEVTSSPTILDCYTPTALSFKFPTPSPTVTSVIRNSNSSDTFAHTTNSISVARSTSTHILPLSSTSHFNRTVTPQLSERPTAVPLSTVLATPSLSITRNTGLPASARADRIPTLVTTPASDSDTISQRTAVGLDVHDEI